MKMQYYLIHGIDHTRKERVLKEFEKFGINNNDVKWITEYNKNELTDDLINNITTEKAKTILTKGHISCTYKHYLALKDIVENNYEYAVIMEDNMAFYSNVPEKLNQYIEHLNINYPDWDILFDLNYYGAMWQMVGDTKDNKLIYPSNFSSRCAQFYLLNKKCATILYENYLPMNNCSDHWMNELFYKFKLKSFWVEPSNVYTVPHTSTV